MKRARAEGSTRRSGRAGLTWGVCCAVCLGLAMGAFAAPPGDSAAPRPAAKAAKPAADKPVADKAAGDKPAADKAAVDKGAAEKAPADKPAADKPTAAKPRSRLTVPLAPTKEELEQQRNAQQKSADRVDDPVRASRGRLPTQMRNTAGPGSGQGADTAQQRKDAIQEVSGPQMGVRR